MDAPGELVKAAALLLRLVRGMEAWGREEDGIPEECWDAYEQAREFLGAPIKVFDGGPEGAHYHDSDFDATQDTCHWCEAYEAEKTGP